MRTIPAKISQRLSDYLKRFQPILDNARIRDINESDTVVLITGILSDMLGYDRYSEITTEHSIRGTYCDLAISIEGKMRFLLEAKAIGTELKENHVKQAVDYAANKGLDWVVLSNGINWKLFRITFSKPISHSLIAAVDFMKLSHKSAEDMELLYVFSREGVAKNAMEDFQIQKQATNRFILGNLITADSVVGVIKKELRQIYPDVRVSEDEIKKVLQQEVIKREVLDGEESIEAKKKIAKSARRKELKTEIVEVLSTPTAVE